MIAEKTKVEVQDLILRVTEYPNGVGLSISAGQLCQGTVLLGNPDTWDEKICVDTLENLETLDFSDPVKTNAGSAQWLTPLIPALWEAKVGVSPEVSSLRPA